MGQHVDGIDDGVGYGVKGENSNQAPAIVVVGGKIPIGVWGDAPHGNAVFGSTVDGDGVFGSADTGTGVAAVSKSGIAVSANSATGIAVSANSGTGVAVSASSDGIAVEGQSIGNKSLGMLGGSDRVFGQPTGVYGESDEQGVFGNSTSDVGTGVYGIARKANGFGVRGESFHDGTAIKGQSFGTGIGIHGKGQRAGLFEGDVEVNGNLTHNGDLTHNGNANVSGTVTMGSQGDIVFADCAEHFEVADVSIQPGTVMVIDSDGKLCPSTHPYDKKVAGVVSGAGNYRPAIVLGKQAQTGSRRLISLVGKVYCKVDADYSPIDVGDLLTTSPTPGHAMKAVDPLNAFGSVIGKALRPLKTAQGMIPVLIALQ
jgi:hypothetical protein